MSNHDENLYKELAKAAEYTAKISNLAEDWFKASEAWELAGDDHRAEKCFEMYELLSEGEEDE